MKYFVKLLSEEVEMNLLFFLALALDKCLQEQDVCEMVENLRMMTG